MTDLIKKLKIEDIIYEIRGVQVMLDSDLAKLYHCKNGTKTINLAVKRHLNRFPERFMFQLTDNEFANLRFQVETSRVKKEYGGRRYNPYVFTEQGVSMLATVLKTEVAVETSIKIMDAFVAMRKYFNTTMLEQKHINNIVLDDHNRIDLLEQSFSKFEEKSKITDIYFSGQIYDAYYTVFNIFNKTKHELVIIDSYADNTLLDIIKRLNVKVTIITKGNGLLTKQDIEKYNKQYTNLSVVYDNTFHDRFFIIDNKDVYHCGTSVNSIGKKTFAINIIGDDLEKKPILNYIKTNQES